LYHTCFVPSVVGWLVGWSVGCCKGAFAQLCFLMVFVHPQVSSRSPSLSPEESDAKHKGGHKPKAKKRKNDSENREKRPSIPALVSDRQPTPAKQKAIWRHTAYPPTTMVWYGTTVVCISFTFPLFEKTYLN
jgi:hypothetical protein